MRTRTPVVLLAGAMYEHFPKLKDMGEGGVRYAVLGHYIVTDIWVRSRCRLLLVFHARLSLLTEMATRALSG